MISERTSTLQITDLVLSDVADYSCLAENNLARPQQQESTRESFGVLCKLATNPKKILIIFFVDPPDVSLSPQAVTINQTGFTSFLCRAFGIPIPGLEWFYNGTAQPIGNSTHYSIFNMVEVNGSNLSIATSVFQITDAVRSSHEGSYVCHATNNVNNLINTPENQSTFLTVQGKKYYMHWSRSIDILFLLQFRQQPLLLDPQLYSV